METKINGIRVFDNYDVDEYIGVRDLIAEAVTDVNGTRVYLFAEYCDDCISHCASKRSIYDLMYIVRSNPEGEVYNELDEAEKLMKGNVPGNFDALWAELDAAIMQVMESNNERAKR